MKHSFTVNKNIYKNNKFRLIEELLNTENDKIKSQSGQKIEITEIKSISKNIKNLSDFNIFFQKKNLIMIWKNLLNSLIIQYTAKRSNWEKNQ